MGRWAILALVTSAYAGSALAALAVAPLVPFLLEAFRLSRVEVGLFLPAVYLGGVLMSLPAGWLTDRLGVRTTMALGQVVTGTMIILAGLSPRVPMLLLCLVAAGLGFSVANPSTGRAVIEWFPVRERGLAMGIKQTGLTLGGIGAALLLPPIALAVGWRRALAVAGGICLLAAVAMLTTYRRRSVAPPPAPNEPPRLAEVVRFLRHGGVRTVFACGLALSVAQASVLAYLALFSKETFALSAVAAGQFLALAQAGGTASRLIWGFVSDRFFGGRRRPGVVVTALIGAGAYTLLSLGDALPPALIAALALAAGVGAFGWVGLYFALVAEIGGMRHAGLLTGVAVMFAWSGMLVGPLLFGLVLQVTGAYAVPWLLLAVTAVAVAIALSRLAPLVQRDSA